LYPLQFLEDLKPLEVERRKLVTNPEEKNVDRHYHTLQEVVKVYVNGLQEHKEALSYLTSDYDEYTYNVLGGEVTANFMLDMLETMKEAAFLQNDKAYKRFRCFKGNVRLCEPLSIGTVNHMRELSTLPTSIPQLPPVVLKNYNIVKSFLETNSRKASFSYPLPFVATGTSTCFPFEDQVYFLGVWSITKDNLPRFKTIYLNDLYFWKLGSEPFLRYARAIPEYDRDLEFQNVANFYSCPDSGQDITAVRTGYEIRARLRLEPILASNARTTLEDIVLEEELFTLKMLEKKIVNSEIIILSHIYAYLNELHLLITTYGEWEIAQRIGSDQVFLIEKLLVLARNNTAFIDEVITEAALQNYAVGIMSQIGMPLSEKELFISRGYPGLFFLSFNKSIVEGEISFIRKPRDFPNTSDNFVSYRRDLKNQFDDDEILEQMILSKKFWITHALFP